MTDHAPRHDELPLPDFDHLPEESPKARIRSLDQDNLRLVAYERAHADRLPVLQALERRLEELDRGAQPTGGDPEAVTPETGARTPPPSPASPETSGPPVSPPSHGTQPTRRSRAVDALLSQGRARDDGPGMAGRRDARCAEPRLSQRAFTVAALTTRSVPRATPGRPDR